MRNYLLKSEKDLPHVLDGKVEASDRNGQFKFVTDNHKVSDFSLKMLLDSGIDPSSVGSIGDPVRSTLNINDEFENV